MQLTYLSDFKVDLIQHCGGDFALSAAAKVLEPAAYAAFLQTGDVDDTRGRLRYMMRHRHGTPFEHSFMTFYVHAPIFVWREWHRHRIGFSYNEESARYKTLDPVFYIPPPDRPMEKVDNWKPGRPKFLPCDDNAKYMQLCDNLKHAYFEGYGGYLDNLEMGFDPGLARDGLPVGIYSSCWVSCNPRSMMNFLSLRTHREDAKFVSYPLWEIERCADKVQDLFADLFPITYAAFSEFGRVAP